jgi:hypothetical protein
MANVGEKAVEAEEQELKRLCADSRGEISSSFRIAEDTSDMSGPVHPSL